jgi:thiamine pyrophosphate-dependent acetolactate synthase large subunit-like protein
MSAAPAWTVADAVGAALAGRDVDTVFGVAGSGNFVVTSRLCAEGARFVAARHEGGATGMADGWARVTGRVGVCSVHQGPGLTNTITALTEAAKSRTPLLVLAGDTPAAALRSNFRIDQHDLVTSVGAITERVYSAGSAAADAARAFDRALLERRPVVLNLAIDLQAQTAAPPEAGSAPPAPTLSALPWPAPSSIAKAADLVAAAERPAIVAGRGAVLSGARAALEELGERCGALLATSAVAHGLFRGLPYDLGISGGFSSPLAAQLLAESDLVLAFGATLNQWTTRHGALTRDATVIHIDVDPGVGAIVGDAAPAATALSAELDRRGVARPGRRTPEVAAAIAARRWRDEPYDDEGGPDAATIDPRTLTIAVDRLLPDDRTVVVDSGHFTGWPAMYLDVPDAGSWLFVNAFQAVGLGLGAAIGAAVARPDRITVAAVGDGGLFLALQELETAARLALPLLVLVYDDAAYGAEVHHFESMGHDVSIARFPDADLAAIARGAGAAGVIVRSAGDLGAVADWARDPRGPLVVDAKVDPGVRAEWLEEAFRGG